MNLNESTVKNDISKALNESVSERPQKNVRPADATEWTFADWFGKDLTGEIYSGNLSPIKAGLTSLRGAPEIVNGDFFCDENELTSLEYAPKEAYYFSCSYNKLTSLKYAPERCHKFDCDMNELTSLAGAPKECSSFSCVNNELTSLAGAPKECEDFYCYGNKLTSLKGFVGDSVDVFDCHDNKLTSLEGAPRVAGHFDCSYNQLTSLEGGPVRATTRYICHNNQLTSLKGGPEKVGSGGDPAKSYFNCVNNKLTSLDGLGIVKGGLYAGGNPVSQEQLWKDFIENNGDLFEQDIMKKVKRMLKKQIEEMNEVGIDNDKCKSLIIKALVDLCK